MNRALVIKNAVLFIVGFCVYMTIEVLFRGYSFAIMGVVGGLSLILLDKINDYLSWDFDLIAQCLIGSVIITTFEFIVGELAKFGIFQTMWDYSDMLFNIDGVICLPFSLAWACLSFVGILVADAINYYVIEDSELPYYRVFGKIVIKFQRKHCSEY